MGANSSRAKSEAVSPAEKSPGGSSVARFIVEPSKNLEDVADERIALEVSDEVLVLKHVDSNKVIRSWAYHRILCWGYTDRTFQWRAYSDPLPLLDSAVGASHEQLASALSAPDSAEVQTYAVITSGGEAVDIECALMSCVRSLMGDMDAKGVPAGQMQGLLKTLQSLAEEGYSEHALQALRQMSIGRAFDAKQAVTLLDTLGVISPFDKVEAAVALYPSALLHPSSLPSILKDSFPEEGDADNVAHRLGLRLTPAGGMEPLSARGGASSGASVRKQ